MLTVDLWSAENNNTISSAQEAYPTPGAEYVIQGMIGDGYYGEDVDIYEVTLTSGQTLTIDADARYADDGTSLSGLDSYLRIFNSSANELASNSYALSANDYSGGSVTYDSYLSFTAPSDSTYYIAIARRAIRLMTPPWPEAVRVPAARQTRGAIACN